ncbi:MAG: [FeFe] hydrogenase H-cluster radical SAM maturase HydE [Candidatus Omnitrophica bacterium]|nr:[FeFe] hydrogenase H-cluster radical SAM maturase HydE [Candidatus Omnitrophota bacterium]
MNKNQIIDILKTQDEAVIQELFKKAYQIKQQHVGSTVFFRGIIEFSNICTKDCFYCGIRKSNKKVYRFSMTAQDIIRASLWAYEQGYGSIVLQSGERSDEDFVEFIEDILLEIKKLTLNKLGITLSLGEQSFETFKRWFDAGAHRYLLRIETSDQNLYKKIHPKGSDHKNRLKCLKMLGEIGYQVGTGVMIGLPFQTYENLADDILFFKEWDIDMIGMGPYIVHKDTPLASLDNNTPETNFMLGLKMIALARIYLKDVNIAATTALQALDPLGREKGLQAGANIIMPNITPVEYRANYLLYEDKPCLDENAAMCRSCLENRISSIGETIGFCQWGDSPHFFKRKNAGKEKEKNPLS